MSDKTRLFERLLQPGQTWESGVHFAPDGRKIGTVTPTPPALAGSIRDSVRVVADDAAKWYWQSANDKWDLRNQRQFGPLRLPYDSMWIEFRTPSLIHEGNWKTVPQEEVGVHMMSAPATEPTFLPQAGRFWPPQGAKDIITCQVVRTFRLAQRPHLYHPDVIGFGAVAEDGRFLSSTTRALDPTVTSIDDPFLQAQMHMFWGDAYVAFLAVSLMNCKNTSLQHHSTQPCRSSKPAVRARREPRLDYHTIKLPAPASSSRQQKIDSAGGAIPLHQVRGHFKTYTPQAPRFGRDVGTYWYDWHVRGNADNGQVISDYRIGMPSQ